MQRKPLIRMFDVSLGEIVVIGGVAVMFLGKRDMPLLFRFAGRGVGKISGMIRGGMARIAEESKDSEFAKMQHELRSSLDDLRVIRSELLGSVQLPAGRTSTSHPGSNALRTPPGVPSAPATSQASSAGTSPLIAGAGAEHAAVGASGMRRAAGIPAAAGPGKAGVRRSAEPSAAAGVAEAASRLRTSRVASPGGDRMQRLAMAEVGFAQHEMYATKTESVPGGADILNEAIIDSLLQERCKTMFQGPQGSGNDRGADEEDSRIQREKGRDVRDVAKDSRD